MPIAACNRLNRQNNFGISAKVRIQSLGRYLEHRPKEVSLTITATIMGNCTKRLENGLREKKVITVKPKVVHSKDLFLIYVIHQRKIRTESMIAVIIVPVVVRGTPFCPCPKYRPRPRNRTFAKIPISFCWINQIQTTTVNGY
ncbi:hypothetical protein QTP88_019609 [Uroleucon formosanum]